MPKPSLAAREMVVVMPVPKPPAAREESSDQQALVPFNTPGPSEKGKSKNLSQNVPLPPLNQVPSPGFQQAPPNLMAPQPVPNLFQQLPPPPENRGHLTQFQKPAEGNKFQQTLPPLASNQIQQFIKPQAPFVQ